MPDPDADLMTIRQRLLEPLLRSVDTAQAQRLSAELINGQWPSVDYADQEPANWATSRHLHNLQLLARAVAVGQDSLRPAALAALDHWLTCDYRNPNWWHNDIGVPRLLAPTLLLLDAELTAVQRNLGAAILARAKLEKTGQNLVWLADITAQRGLLQGDGDLVQAAYDRIAAEIVITEAEGVQIDGSFHQHGACLYNHGYGAGFASDGARIAALLRGTRFAFSQEKIDLLTALVLDGHQWFTRGRWQDYGTIGREIARAGHNAGYLEAVTEHLLQVPTGREEELRTMRDRLSGQAPQLSGHRHFWRGDISVVQRPAFYASARFYSSRLLNTDRPHNGEALRSHHIADGCTFFSRTGLEYSDIFPVWDWQHVPGTTVVQTPELSGELCRPGSRAFAGGVSDGTHGLAAVDFERDSLRARKSWFFLGDQIVALGAGVSDSSGHSVHTTINQCFLAGQVTQGQSEGRDWVHHDGITYFDLAGGRLHLHQGTATGSWHDISRSASAEPISHDLFTLWLDHGSTPQSAAYAYVVAPTLALADVQRGQSPVIELIANTASLQVVREANLGLTGIVFYEAGSADLGPHGTIAADQACLLLLREAGDRLVLSAANPLNAAADLTLQLSQKLSGEGVVDLLGGGSQLVLVLPGGGSAGQSVTREFGKR